MQEEEDGGEPMAFDEYGGEVSQSSFRQASITISRDSQRHFRESYTIHKKIDKLDIREDYIDEKEKENEIRAIEDHSASVKSIVKERRETLRKMSLEKEQKAEQDTSASKKDKMLMHRGKGRRQHIYESSQTIAGKNQLNESQNTEQALSAVDQSFMTDATGDTEYPPEDSNQHIKKEKEPPNNLVLNRREQALRDSLKGFKIEEYTDDEAGLNSSDLATLEKSEIQKLPATLSNLVRVLRATLPLKYMTGESEPVL